jgi:hypothetical protein
VDSGVVNGGVRLCFKPVKVVPLVGRAVLNAEEGCSDVISGVDVKDRGTEGDPEFPILRLKVDAPVPVVGTVLEFVTGNGGDDGPVGKTLPEEGFVVSVGVVVGTALLVVVEGVTIELGGAPGREALGSETDEAVSSTEEGSEDVNHGSTALEFAIEVALRCVEFTPGVGVRRDPVEFQLETDVVVGTGVLEAPLVVFAVGSVALVDSPGIGAAEPVVMALEPVELEVKIELGTPEVLPGGRFGDVETLPGGTVGSVDE